MIKLIAGYLVAQGASYTMEGSWCTTKEEIEQLITDAIGIQIELSDEMLQEIANEIVTYEAIAQVDVIYCDEEPYIDITIWDAYCGL